MRWHAAALSERIAKESLLLTSCRTMGSSFSLRSTWTSVGSTLVLFVWPRQ
jgi:hypothetical protein